MKRLSLAPAALAPVALALALGLGASTARADKLVTGVSQDQVPISVTFDGSDILVYGAVSRDGPLAPGAKQDIVITMEGPAQALVVRKKARQFGIWANKGAVKVDSAPSFYSVSTTAPLDQAMSQAEDQKYHVSIPLAIRETSGQTTAKHPEDYINALIDIRTAAGQYEMNPDTVKFQDGTLFSTRVKLPANLTEGVYKLRIFLTQDGKVLDEAKAKVEVNKTGVERWLYNLSLNHAAIYGIMSLFIAAAAGWLASAAFSFLRR